MGRAGGLREKGKRREKEKMVIKNATVIDEGLMAYERVTQLKRIWCT